jgi:8-oxo-dGTP pyrophosphatase MutT (NUDIX family)
MDTFSSGSSASEDGRKRRLGQKWLRDLVVFVVGMAVGCIFLFALNAGIYVDQSKTIGISDVTIPMIQFPEPAWRTPSTLSVRTVASTPFARFEIHKVKTESGVVVSDWLWTDERSHVNILVHLKDENKYLVFKQKKYGLEREYFALIGGLFNEGETGLQCAQRELLEETGLEAEEMIDLGKYRVQVNRGGGILYAYYAKNSFKSHKIIKPDADYEKQAHVKLTRDELIDISLSGEIGEAQWVATAALGLLYEEHKEDHPDHKNTDGLKPGSNSGRSTV